MNSVEYIINDIEKFKPKLDMSLELKVDENTVKFIMNSDKTVDVYLDGGYYQTLRNEESVYFGKLLVRILEISKTRC